MSSDSLEDRAIARLAETLLRDFERVRIDVVAHVLNEARASVVDLNVEPAHRLAVIDCLARDELRLLDPAVDDLPTPPAYVA